MKTNKTNPSGESPAGGIENGQKSMEPKSLADTLHELICETNHKKQMLMKNGVLQPSKAPEDPSLHLITPDKYKREEADRLRHPDGLDYDTIAEEEDVLEQLEKGKLTPKKIKKMNKKKKAALARVIQFEMSRLKGEEREEFYAQIKEVAEDDTKHAIWEENHSKLVACINNSITKNGIMPSISALARQTGLSRPTVTKHVEEYKNDNRGAERLQRFTMAQDALLAALYKKAVSGDLPSMKFLYEITGLYNPMANKQLQGAVNIQTQHNYIQINGTRLSQEEVQQLEPGTRTQIEGLLKKALPAGRTPIKERIE